MQDTVEGGGTAPQDETGSARARWSRWVRPGAFGAAGLLAGGLLAGSLTATADESTTSEGGSGSGAATAPGGAGGLSGDPSQPQRSDEELLTGSTADKVEAAALAEYPGATVVRIETDSDGVYEAHLTTADGEQVTVEVDKYFEVTGTEAHGGPGGPGGHGGPVGAEPGSTGDGTST